MTDIVEDLGPLPYASKVEAMAGYGLSPADIARVLDIDVEELKASYEKELAGGHIKANARVAESLYRKAIGEGRESVVAAIFWLKTRARWKETSVTEHGGITGQPVERVDQIKVIIVDPQLPGPIISTSPAAIEPSPVSLRSVR